MRVTTAAPLDYATASAVARRHLDPQLNVTAIRVMPGGMVFTVLDCTTDGGAGSFVIKYIDRANYRPLLDERRALEWYRQHTHCPVPRTYGCGSIDEGDPSGFCGTYLMMERLPGANLELARFSRVGHRRLMIELAQYLAHLHTNRRETYGDVFNEQGYARWLDFFAPAITREFETVREQLSSPVRGMVADLLPRLEEVLPESGQPTLIHGDLWASNIIVDDRHPDRPVISGFIDVSVHYSDVEFELAYLRLFRTVDRAFLAQYAQTHPLRPGFNRRCRIYWLYFLLAHLRQFGTTYLRNCETLIRQIDASER